MKKQHIKTIIVIMVSLFIGFIIGGIGRSVEPEDFEHHHEVGSVEEWTCSMHPQIRQDEPGQCPLCGMDLIPVSIDDESTNTNEIRMSENAMKLASVQTIEIQESYVEKQLSLNGKLVPNEVNVSTQGSHFSGRIEQMLLSYTGEYVKKGDLIANIYSPELNLAQKELLEAYKYKEQYPELYQASIQKLKNLKLTEEQIKNIISSGDLINVFPVKSDLNGVVIKKYVNQGSHVKRGDLLYEIADLSSVWLMFDLYEKDLQWLKVGDQITYRFQALPGEAFTGLVSFVDPVINSKTRVARARVELKNPDGIFRPGMFATGEVFSKSNVSKLQMILPKSAVLWTGERSVVYVKTRNENGVYFEMREVLIAGDAGRYYIIKKGLRNGESVAIQGVFSIDAAAQLAGKKSMMNMEPELNKAHIESESSITHVVEEHKGWTEAEINQLRPLLETYLQLKNALVEDDMKEALAKSARFNNIVSQVDMSVFSEKVHLKWMHYKKAYGKKTQELSVSNIKELREHFYILSDELIAFLDKGNLLDKAIYLQYCPMANSNEGGFWLSLEEEVRNPYFGASMLHCGEVISTIN